VAIKVVVIPIGIHVFVNINNSDIFLISIGVVNANQNKGIEEQSPTGLDKHLLLRNSKQHVGDVMRILVTACVNAWTKSL
jgi:hypothetical protein